MSWWFVLYVFEHLINHIISLLQSISGLCFTNQSYPKNMSMPFKSMTTTSICSLCPLIFTSNGANWVTSLFFVLSVLKTSNDPSMDSVLIFSFLTSCLLIPVWVHSESTNACNCSSFPFFVLMLVCIFSSLALLFLQFEITYQFWDLLCTKVCCIMSTLNLWQNLPLCHPPCLICLSPLGFSWSSSSIWICNLLLSVLLCHTCSISSSLFLSLVSCILLPYVHMYYSWNILVFHFHQSYLKLS